MRGKILKILAWSLAIVNFWVFSRSTVDDPFITWRYGRNLVEHGVWNYNPTTFDPTQAYTNPIFALLSIIPAAFGINVVLFFKILAVILMLGLILFFLRTRPSANLPLALFFALPATMIHIFSGLETFLYVVLVFFLILAIHSSNTKLALLTALTLFLTRPESWLLVLLVPLALSFQARSPVRRFDFVRFAKYFAVLAIPLSAYFLIHISIFGQMLPNTSFVKSGQYFLNPSVLIWLLTLSPLLVTWMLGYRKVTAFAATFSGIVAYHYSTAYLSMNYAFRYEFHVLAPLILFIIYLLAGEGDRIRFQAKLLSLFKNRTMAVLAIPLFAVGLVAASLNLDYCLLANRYPKLLATHGQVGYLIKDLNKTQKIRAIAVGDAGLIPYNADLPNLDLLRLGTHIGATEGISKRLIDRYQVDFAVLRGYKYAEAKIVKALEDRNLKYICQVDFSDDYHLTLWAKETDQRMQKVCDSSKVFASESEFSFFLQDVQLAPWTYWR